jgi:hypothetical protein
MLGACSVYDMAEVSRWHGCAASIPSSFDESISQQLTVNTLPQAYREQTVARTPGVLNSKCTLSLDTPPVFCMMNATAQMSFLAVAANDSAHG